MEHRLIQRVRLLGNVVGITRVEVGRRLRLAPELADEPIVELDSLVEIPNSYTLVATVSAIITFVDKHAGCTVGRNTGPTEKTAIGATGFENRHDGCARPELLRHLSHDRKDVVTQRRRRILRCLEEGPAHVDLFVADDGFDTGEDRARRMAGKQSAVQGATARWGSAFGA